MLVLYSAGDLRRRRRRLCSIRPGCNYSNDPLVRSAGTGTSPRTYISCPIFSESSSQLFPLSIRRKQDTPNHLSRDFNLLFCHSLFFPAAGAGSAIGI